MQEGTWVTVDGTDVDYTFWASNEPNNANGGVEDCGVMHGLSANRGTWNDQNCADSLFYICKKAAICNAGTYLSGNTCVKCPGVIYHRFFECC